MAAAIPFWTLEYNGVEQSLTAWGFTNPRLRFVSQSESTLTVRVPGVSNLVANPPIPFEAQVILRRNRTSAGGGLFAANSGNIVFQGRQVTRRGMAATPSAADTLIFADAWYDLSNLVFQQQWQYGSLATTFFSRLNLFQRYAISTTVSAATNGSGVINITVAAPLFLQNGDFVTAVGLPGVAAPAQVTVVDGTHFSIPGQLSAGYTGGGVVWPNHQLITNGAQMTEIINYAAISGLPIKAGTIDLDYFLPIYPVRGVMCSSALQICMQPTPDAVCWLDYGTIPPRFNCRKRPNLVPVTLPYSDGVMHISTDITPRPDLQAPQVVIQYQKNNSVNGALLTTFFTDAYPLGSTGQAIRSIVCPIDLRGAQRTDVAVQVTANALNLNDLSWWKHKKNELNAVTALAMIPGTLLVVRDDNLADITDIWAATFPNEYVKGEISPWMGIQAVWVTIMAKFSYFEFDPSNRRNTTVTEHQVSVRVKLTNSPVGAVTYDAIQAFDSGETAPEGLAQSIWTSLQPLQYEGTHVMVDPGIDVNSTILGPQNLLNISGGGRTWLGMGAVIQSAEYDLFSSRAEITFGPAKHIAPGDLEQLLQFYRFRVVTDNTSLRISGQESSGSTTVGGDTAAENTTHANPVASLITISSGPEAQKTRIQHDANSSLIQLQVQDASGNIVANTSGFKMATADLEDDGTKRQASFQWLFFEDSDNGCAKMKMKVFGTPPEPAT